MALITRKFQSRVELDFFLTGGIIGGTKMPGRRIYGLDGRTLIFTAPAATVTFASVPVGTQMWLLFPDIKAQIEAAAATLRVTLVDGRIAINLATLTGTPIEMSAAGTANTIFGFSNSVATAGTFYAPPAGMAPALVSFSPDWDGYVVITDEP
jgi:hypothetical protein